MLLEPMQLIRDFKMSLPQALTSVLDAEESIIHDLVPAPHRPPSLRHGCSAIYVFSLSESYGSTCPAGAHRVLKVGKVGQNSQPRFQYQHYSPASAGSTLAGSILVQTERWKYLGAENLNLTTVGGWLKRNADRDHFFLDARIGGRILTMLEAYLITRLTPLYEGRI